MYMRFINSSNYENDEREYLLRFLSYITENKQKKVLLIRTILMMKFHLFLKILYQSCQILN